MSYLGSSAAPMVQAFSGPFAEQFNGGVASLTLSRSVSKTTDITLVINNIPQSPFDGSYSVSNKTVTLAETVSAGVGNIYVRYNDAPVASITPLDGTVSYAKLAPDMQAATFAFKNRIINGAMMIDQRNAGATMSPVGTSAYMVDRWQAVMSQAGKFNAQQNQGSVTPPAGFSNYLGLTVASAATIGASDYFSILQKIEGFNTADLSWGTVNAQAITLSFRVYSSLTGTFSGAIENGANNRSYPFSYVVSSANTWTTVSVTIPGDTTGTWVGATNGVGMGIWFDLGCGSSFRGTANTWAGAQYIGVTGTVQVAANAGATFYITGVQLEKGSTATSFDYRPYGTELALCYRYYYRMNAGALYAPYGAGYNYSAALFSSTTFLPVTMRVPPTGIEAPAAGNFYVQAGGNNYTPTAVTFARASQNTVQLNATISGATAGQGGQLFDQLGSSYIGFTGAEL